MVAPCEGLIRNQLALQKLHGPFTWNGSAMSEIPNTSTDIGIFNMMIHGIFLNHRVLGSLGRGVHAWMGSGVTKELATWSKRLDKEIL